MSQSESLWRKWRYFWGKRAGYRGVSRLAAYLVALGTRPYHARAFLTRYCRQGYVAPSAAVQHDDLRLGRRVYIGDRCFVFASQNGGCVQLEDGVQIYGETTLQTGFGGRIVIGAETHVQPRCLFSAFVGPIELGRRVEVAPSCAFYSYNHGFVPGIDIMSQPLSSRGGIRVGDGAWLGHGVIVLDGVDIGTGAVIAAGAVVHRSIPENAIAGGIPAKVIKFRQ